MMARPSGAICDAMRDAGIKDPQSKEGIDFCTSQCPYEDRCVVMESKGSLRKVSRRERAAKLIKEGRNDREISSELNLSTRTIGRYRKEVSNGHRS